MDSLIYPARGKVLRQAVGATGNVVVNPEVTAIPNGGYSETFAGHNGLSFNLEFVFGAAATGDVLIEKVADAAATVAGTTYDTCTAANELSKNWPSSGFVGGFFRIQNTSGQTVTVYLQQKRR
jgi:hypothetical protein